MFTHCPPCSQGLVPAGKQQRYINNSREQRLTEIKAYLLRRLTDAALISVVVAGGPNISRWTVTVEHTSNGIGVTLRALSAGITDAGIIKMAEQT